MIITHNGTILKHEGTILTKITEVPPQPPFTNTYSLDFDGVDDYVNIGNGVSFEYTDSFSYSFWVKPNVVSGVKYLFTKYALSGRGILMYYNSAGAATPAAISFNLYNTNGGSTATRKRITTTTGNILTKGVWNNIVITYDGSGLGSGIKLYKNGVGQTVIVTQDNLQNQTIVVSQDAYLSSFNGASSFLAGNQDEFAIFNTELSSADASVIYGSGQTNDLTSLSPTAWYRMGDNGAYKSPQWLIPSNENKDKVSNYSLELDGIDDYIDLGNDSSLDIFGSDFTISLWAKWGAQTTNSNGLVNFASNTNKAVITLGFSTQYGKISFGTGSSSIVGILYDCGSGYDDGDWHHIMCTLEGSTRTIYVDGVDISSSGSVSSIGVGSNNDIGNRARSRYFVGNIDEVSIFDSVIPIGDIWNGSGQPTTISGAVAHWRMGEEATFSGGVWTVPDQVGSNDGTSNAMTIEDRVGEAPNSNNNALSFNMESVDRITDVPT